MKINPVLFLLVMLLPVPVIAAETAVAARDQNMLAEPNSEAKVVGKLVKNDKFEVLKRDKSWALVSTGSQQGWILIFYLSWGEAPASKPDPMKEVAASLGLISRKQEGQVTAVLGIRGIDEETLKAAKFNGDELKKMESFLVPKEAATLFASEGMLTPLKVEYLPAPVLQSPNDPSAPQAP